MTGESPNHRAPVSHRWVWGGLIALAIAVLAVFVGGYLLLVRYDRKVAQHIPKDTFAAVCVDVEQVVLYEPFRKHVFPVLDGASVGAERLKRLKDLSGVNLGMDLRELLVAVRPDGAWVLVVGGLFRTENLVEAIAQIATEQHPPLPCVLRATRLECGSSLVLQQAEDGVLVVGSNPQVVAAAITGSDWATHTGMDIQAPLSWSVALPEGSGAKGLTRIGPNAATVLGAAAAAAGADWLSQVERLNGRAELSDPLNLTLVIEGLSASNRLAAVSQSLQRVQMLASLAPGPDLMGERAILARTVVEEDNGRPALSSTWKREEVERAARVLAEAVDSWLSGR